MKKDRKIVELNDDSRKWWGKEEVEWAIKDKSGDWWLVAGSEFPETRVGEQSKTETKTVKSNKSGLVVLLSALLGASAGLNAAFLYFLFKIIL